MADRIMQCCYSNLATENGAIGWRVAAVSDGVTPEIKEIYKKLQDRNICNSEPLDKNGNSLNMYEVVVEGAYVYLTRITYGLMVPGGRKNNMLSHTYLFPVADGALTEPNRFLTVMDSNFTGNIQVAEHIRTEFERSAPYTMADALSACGLDTERYRNLIYCMHMRREQKKTLFIHTSKPDSVIRPFLYVLLSSIPLSMRRDFSFASAVVNANTVKTVIFSDQHAPDDLYFDLDTGANNVLDTRAVKKYSRWGYVDFYANHYEDPGVNTYFQELEDMAVKLGDPKASKSKILRIAHQMMMGEKTASEDSETLRTKLYEALLAPVSGSAYMDDYMARLLDQINSADVRLDAEVERELMRTLKTEVSPAFEKTREQYMIRRISWLSTEEGAEILAQIPQDKFAHYAAELMKTGKGDPYLDRYFAEKYELEPLSWSGMDRFLDDIQAAGFDDMPLTTARWLEGCLTIFGNSLNQGKDAEKEYKKFKEEIAPFANPSSELQYRLRACEKYWEKFSFESYDYENKEYPIFRLPDNAVSDACDTMSRMMKYILSGDVEGYRREKDLFLDSYVHMLSAGARIRIYENLDRALRGSRKNANGKYLLSMGYVEFVSGEKLENKIGYMLDALKRQNFETYEQLYGEILNKFSDQRLSGELIGRFHENILIQMEMDLFKPEDALDALLLMGETLYKNPFEILDSMNSIEGIPQSFGEIQHLDVDFLLGKSLLLQKGAFIEQAEEYKKFDSLGGDVALAWVDLSRLRKKAQKKANRTEGFRALGGKMRGLFNGRKSE